MLFELSKIFESHLAFCALVNSSIFEMCSKVFTQIASVLVRLITVLAVEIYDVKCNNNIKSIQQKFAYKNVKTLAYPSCQSVLSGGSLNVSNRKISVDRVCRHVVGRHQFEYGSLFN